MPTSDLAPILIDTHIWLWLQAGEFGTIGAVEHADLTLAAREGRLFLSIISIWEVALLEAKNRLTLTDTCENWVRKALQSPVIALQPLNPEIAIASTRLPGNFHGDPADRIIVATARHTGSRLLTHDKAMLSYCHAHHIPLVGKPQKFR